MDDFERTADENDVDKRIDIALRKVRSLLPHHKLSALENLEKHLELGERALANDRTAMEFELLAGSGCGEEELHKFILENEVIWSRRHLYGDRVISGVLSKFPISPDRVVDLFCFEYLIGVRQGTANRIRIIEFKKPSAPIFGRHGRMSQDLNDGWMECNEAIRLGLINYEDILRRSIKAIKKKTRFYKEPDGADIGRPGFLSLSPPVISAEVIIGRRSSLSPDELDTMRGLCRAGSVSVFTYDHLIDRLRDGIDIMSFDRLWY